MSYTTNDLNFFLNCYRAGEAQPPVYFPGLVSASYGWTHNDSGVYTISLSLCGMTDLGFRVSEVPELNLLTDVCHRLKTSSRLSSSMHCCFITCGTAAANDESGCSYNSWSVFVCRIRYCELLDDKLLHWFSGLFILRCGT